MVRSSKKSLCFCLLTCVALLLGQTGSVGGTENVQPIITLQPQGLNHSGVYGLRLLEPHLTGSGVKFAVICRSITYIEGEPQNDYQPSFGHNCFKGKRLGFYDSAKWMVGTSPHSTAICSLLVGEDANAYNHELGRFYYQGTAPGAAADIYEFWHFLTNNVFPHSPPDADIITASIGNQSEDWWTRGIESLAEEYGLIVVAGIGNGTNAQDPPLYPGACANVIGVGVVDSVNAKDLAISLTHFALAYPEHSTVGPTADGRAKPDIVGPGNCLAADSSNPYHYEPMGSWSSFSTPIVAGAIGLLVQKAKEDPNLSWAVSPEAGNCVIKAILLNSATKLPYWHKGLPIKDDDHEAPLDYIQGAGMLNAVSAYEHLVAGLNKPGDVSTTGWDNNVPEKDENPEQIYKITVTKPADKFIAATVAWNKHYASVYPFEAAPNKDNNLRLELWAVDTNDPNNDYLLDYSDSNTDNVEHIYCRADANYTSYELVISTGEIRDPNQHYGLAWNVAKGQNSDNIFWYDLNSDGIVDDSDFATLLDNWIMSNSPNGYFIGDINNNGGFDVNDVRIILDHYNMRADWHGK